MEILWVLRLYRIHIVLYCNVYFPKLAQDGTICFIGSLVDQPLPPTGQVAKKVRLPRGGKNVCGVIDGKHRGMSSMLRFGIKMALKVFGLDSDPMWWGPAVESRDDFQLRNWWWVQRGFGWCVLFFVVTACVEISSSCTGVYHEPLFLQDFPRQWCWNRRNQHETSSSWWFQIFFEGIETTN